MKRSRLCCLFLATLLVACNGTVVMDLGDTAPPTRVDGSMVQDSGTPPDTGMQDARVRDTGMRPDAMLPPVSFTCMQTFYAAPSGTADATGDEANPLSLEGALARAGAGVCIEALAGTYVLSSTLHPPAGEPGLPIVLRSHDGFFEAVLDAGGVRGPAILLDRSHIAIEGFAITNMPTGSGEQAITVRGNGDADQDLLIRGCRVTGGHNHLKVNGMATGVVVEQSEFYGEFGHIPISITGADGMVMRDNVFRDWVTGGNGAIQIKGGSRDVWFTGNTLQNVDSAGGVITLGDGCGSSCDNDPDHYAGRRLHAVNNVFISVGRVADLYGCLDCVFAHNTVIASARSTVAIKLGSASTGGVERSTENAVIVNNVLSGDGSLFGVMQINGNAGSGLDLNHNLYWNSGASITFGGTFPGMGSNSLQGDPQLDATGVPGTTSPVRDAGRDGVVETDKTGAARDATPDLGAYELR